MSRIHHLERASTHVVHFQPAAREGMTTVPTATAHELWNRRTALGVLVFWIVSFALGMLGACIVA